MFVSHKIGVSGSEKGKGIYTLAEIVKDELILEFEQQFLKKATRTSLQIDEHKHQESTNPEALENFINHSCNPNGYINYENLTYHSLRPVKLGEELTFDYLTSDYELSEEFKCKCGSENCRGEIKGFKYLTLDEKKKLEPYLSPYLKKKLEEEINSSNK